MHYKIVRIKFPYHKELGWRIFISKEIKALSEPINIEIDCHSWLLNRKDLIELYSKFNKYGHNIIQVKSNTPETIISAKSLSIEAELYIEHDQNKTLLLENDKNQTREIIFHKGTIRSGEHLTSEGDLMVLGDVNPGAVVSADGDVMIWGKLLGIAHAGKSGNYLAKISALFLKPIQLRIADKVAKGPKENQEIGLSEQAEILNGLIVIKPLSTEKSIPNQS